EIRCVEFGDCACATTATADVIPETFTAHTKRRNDANTRNHDLRSGRAVHGGNLYQMSTLFEFLFVWSGGAIFVASLAYCAYSYVFPWTVPLREAPFAVPGIGIGWPALAFDGMLVSVFAFHHSVFARVSVKAWLSRKIAERFLRSFYVWIASILLIAL